MDSASVLSEVSDLLSIASPIILLIWFYYSQFQVHSKNYFQEVKGTYAGFTDPQSKIATKKQIHSGIIMNVKELDSNGYFKGSFNYGETQFLTENNTPIKDSICSGIFTFFGQIDFKLYRNQNRHPYNADENRKYIGKLYVVDRLDFGTDQKIEAYVSGKNGVN